MALMAEDTDRLSALSGEILSHHILTRLPLKEAIASSLLSSRWRWLWTRLSRLNFSPEFYTSLRNKGKISSIMKKLILINSEGLESFELHITELYTQEFRGYSYIPVEDKVRVFHRKMHACISYAALRNVKQLTLVSLNSRVRSMPSSVFSCQRLTSLILHNLDTKYCNSTHFGGFPCLKICSFRSIDLCDASLEHLLAGSPHIESLTICGCVGLINLTVCCPFLNDLSIEIGWKENALCHLQGQDYVPSIVKLICPQLLNLKLERIPYWEDKSMLLKKMVVEINLPACRGLSTNIICVKEVLDGFPNLEDLSTDAQRFLDYQTSFQREICERRKDSTLLEGKLRRVQVITSEFGEIELNLLSYILENCPLLETVTLSPPSHVRKSTLDLIFVHKLLGLQRSSANAKILITHVN